MRPLRPGRQTQEGISLVELMIGLTLSLFILGALAQAFAFASESRRTQESTARLMDGGRAASELVGRALRMATYWGCTGVDNKDLEIHADGVAAQDGSDYARGYATRGLYGVDVGSNGTSELITWQALDNVSVTLQSAASLAPPNTDSPDVRTPLTVQGSASEFKSGDWVALANCQYGDVFRLNTVNGNQFDLSGSCKTCAREYLASTTMLRVQRNRFYIATGARGRPSLFLQRDDGAGQELVEGVEAMSIRYGIDANGDGLVDMDGTDLDYKDTAAKVTALCTTENPTCWGRVASVRIAFLMSSVEDGVLDQPQAYRFNGQTVTASDRRLRREFVSVLSVRNLRT